MQSRWTYFQRVLYDDRISFQKENETIVNQLISSLYGNHATEYEADLSSLPVKKGALSIINPTYMSKQRF